MTIGGKNRKISVVKIEKGVFCFKIHVNKYFLLFLSGLKLNIRIGGDVSKDCWILIFFNVESKLAEKVFLDV